MIYAPPPIGNERDFARGPYVAVLPFRNPWQDWSDDEDYETSQTSEPPACASPENEPSPPPNQSPRCGMCTQYDSSDLSPLPIIKVRQPRTLMGAGSSCTRMVRVHQECAEWAPEVFRGENDKLVNVDKAYAQCRRLSCTMCGSAGAPIGCFVDSCRKTFHYRCLKLGRG